MKKLTVTLCAVLWAMPLLAETLGRRHRIVRSETATSVVVQAADPELVASVWKDAVEQPRGRNVRAETIGDNRSARYFIFPVTGSTPGGNGTFFRSDVTLINYGSAAEDVIALYWPAGQSTPPSVSGGVRLTLPAARAVTYTDFVGTVLNKSGLGAIFIFPVRGSAVDLTAAIDGISRIYTKQPGTEGTVSQEFPPVDVDNLLVADTSVSLGLRQDDNFRTNFGIVNADRVQHIVRVTATGERATNQTTVTVPAYGMLQTNIPPGDYGALTVAFDIIDSGGKSISWVAYASSTDNITGDGWVSIASADLTPGDLTFIGYGR